METHIKTAGTAPQFEYTQHEKRCAQFIDQLTPLIVADGHYVGPKLFQALSLRLAELLPDDSPDARIAEASRRNLEERIQFDNKYFS